MVRVALFITHSNGVDTMVAELEKFDEYTVIQWLQEYMWDAGGDDTSPTSTDYKVSTSRDGQFITVDAVKCDDEITYVFAHVRNG